MDRYDLSPVNDTRTPWRGFWGKIKELLNTGPGRAVRAVLVFTGIISILAAIGMVIEHREESALRANLVLCQAIQSPHVERAHCINGAMRNKLYKKMNPERLATLEGQRIAWAQAVDEGREPLDKAEETVKQWEYQLRNEQFHETRENESRRTRERNEAVRGWLSDRWDGVKDVTAIPGELRDVLRDAARDARRNDPTRR